MDDNKNSGASNISHAEAKRAERQRNDANNAKNIQNAAEVAIASGNPYAVAAGKAVQIGDKISGGRASKNLGKKMSRLNRFAPSGKRAQKLLNKLSESGASDKIGKAAAMKNRGKGGNGAKKSSNGNTQSKGNNGIIKPTKSTNTPTSNNELGKNSNDRIKLKTPIIKVITTIIIPLIPLFFILLLAIFILSFFSDDDSSGGVAGGVGGYYPIDCQDVTVILVDENYEITGNATYELEDYVAGVINNEVGMFGNIEVYKQIAIAARTYFVKNKNDDCSIEASDRRQTFSEVTDSTPNGDLMKQAAEETKGQVLLNKDGELINSEYDAFCSIEVDNNYYTIKQKKQKIPKNWVDSQSGIADEWKQGDCSGNHGRGMSQWGSYYLATEENYTYDKLIAYYLGSENVSISSEGFMSSIAGLEIKATTNASYELNQPISTFLSSKGSSLAQYNSFIKESVQQVGAGTREGVVTAAVSAINYLYDNFNTKLPYYWGGHYPNAIGIPESFGNNTPSSTSPGGNRYPYVSFDCSGFVNWAIVNGGYIFGDTNTYASRFPGCNITNSSCKGQPGDLIDTPSHVVMIVSVDEDNNRYFVAESTGSGVIIQPHGMHDKVYGVESTVVHMDSFYSNNSNVNSNY